MTNRTSTPAVPLVAKVGVGTVHRGYPPEPGGYRAVTACNQSGWGAEWQSVTENQAEKLKLKKCKKCFWK